MIARKEFSAFAQAIIDLKIRQEEEGEQLILGVPDVEEIVIDVLKELNPNFSESRWESFLYTRLTEYDKRTRKEYYDRDKQKFYHWCEECEQWRQCQTCEEIETDVFKHTLSCRHTLKTGRNGKPLSLIG